MGPGSDHDGDEPRSGHELDLGEVAAPDSLEDGDRSLVPKPTLGLALEGHKARVLGALFPRIAEPPTVGRYVVLDTLGRGGMGVVLRAFDRELDRPVALKVLHGDLGERHTTRLRREARAMAKLSHPNVVQVYEVGELDGRTFVAMELVKGQTAKEWMRGDPRPGWRACVEVFMQLGRGLAAAHAKGLVHRDFKPSNAIIDEEGRPRVLDFGLARGTRRDEGQGDESSSNERARTDPHPAASLEESMTDTGTVLGTPAYMPPEQMKGYVTDARSDQFSFCVSLYEALYGERPYVGNSRISLLMALRDGMLRPIPRGSAVPEMVRTAVVRGLAREPDERWPDMEALLQALETSLAKLDGTHTKNRRRWTLGALGVSVSTAVAAIAMMPPEMPTPCEFDRSTLSGTWDEERRDALREHFMATELGFAHETFGTTEAALDDWSDQWIDALSRTCRATRVTGEQSETIMDERKACLDRKRRELTSIVDVLQEAEPRELANIGEVMSRLPDVGVCSDLDHLGTPFPPPRNAEDRTRLEQLQDRLDRVRTSLLIGDRKGLAVLVDALLVDAEQLGHPPLELEVEMLAARLSLAVDDLDVAIPRMRDVAHTAEALGLDELVATFRVQLAFYLAGEWSQPDKEEWLVAEADAALRRLGRPDDPRELDLLDARAALSCQRGDHAGALDLHREILARLDTKTPEISKKIAKEMEELGQVERAKTELEEGLELARMRYGRGAPVTGHIHFDLGNLLLDQGELDRSADHLEGARAIYTSVYGADAVHTARALFATAKLAMANGDVNEAHARLDSVLDVFEAKLGPSHQLTAQALTGRGVLRYHAHDFQGSVDDYQRALDIQRSVLGPQHEEIGVLHSNIGESLIALGDYQRALSEFELALEVLERTPTHPRLALPLKGRGQALLALGRPRDAILSLEHAVDLLERSKGEPYEVADTQLSLASALWALRREPERARTLLDDSRSIFAKLGVEHRVEEATSLKRDLATDRSASAYLP